MSVSVVRHWRGAMSKVALLLLGLTALSACSSGTDDRGVEKLEALKADARKAWANCLFELDKIEAIRGRNLDDLNVRGSIARNQFMVDCMATTDAIVSPELLAEMSRYAANTTRKPNDLNLTSGTRSLPGDEPPGRD